MKLRSKLHMEPYLLDKFYGGAQGSAIKSGVHLPGTAGNYISTPDSVLNSITGDIDIRVCAKATDWGSAEQALISKWGNAGQLSWRFTKGPSSKFRMHLCQDGTNTLGSNVAPFAYTFTNGQTYWSRVTVQVNNGSGSYVVQYYTSVDGITWTYIGGATTAGVISLFDSTAPIEVGSSGLGAGLSFDGTIYYAEVRNGIDGPMVAKFDSSQVAVSGSLTPATINGWTWNGSALYKRDDYVRLPGTNGNYLSFPDTVANSVLGDIDVRAKVSADLWVPAATQYFLAKRASGVLNSYEFYLQTDGRLALTTTADGSTTLSDPSSVATGLVNGSVKWVRATKKMNDGSGNRITSFYLSDDGITWTPLGSPVVTAGVTSIFDGAAPVEVGSRQGGINVLAGNIYYAEVRNGINGPVVASFDARVVQTPWTINGSGWNWEGSSFSGKPGIALQFPNTASHGNYVTTPDTAGNSVLGDIDLRVKLSEYNWTAEVASGQLIHKYSAAGNQRGFRFGHNSTGLLTFDWSADGATFAGSKSSTVVVPFTPGQVGWVRSTLVVATGQVAFFTSLDGITWTPLGTLPSAVGATSIFDSNQLLRIGVDEGGGSNIYGTLYYAEVRNGIDGPIVAMFDPARMARTGTRTPASTVQPGGTPNMLSPNQASIETDASGWAASTNATVAQDATQFLDGTKSLSITAVAIGISQAFTSPRPKITGGKLYTFRASFKAAVTGRATYVLGQWYDAAGAFISNSAQGNSTDVTTGWTEATLTALAPINAAGVDFIIRINDAAQAAGEVHYVDRVSLVEAAEVWTINGSAWDLVAA